MVYLKTEFIILYGKGKRYYTNSISLLECLTLCESLNGTIAQLIEEVHFDETNDTSEIISTEIKLLK